MKTILFISISILFVCCKNTEKSTVTTNTVKDKMLKPTEKPNISVKEALFLTMERTPCFGKCPSYKITIFNTGNVIYEGKSHTEKIGKFSTKLTQKQLKEIQQMMDEIDIMGMKTVYDSAVTDYPSTFLYIVSNGKKKKILDRVDAPATLKQFEKLIDFFVLNENLVPLPTYK